MLNILVFNLNKSILIIDISIYVHLIHVWYFCIEFLATRSQILILSGVKLVGRVEFNIEVI